MKAESSSLSTHDDRASSTDKRHAAEVRDETMLLAHVVPEIDAFLKPFYVFRVSHKILQNIQSGVFSQKWKSGGIGHCDTRSIPE